MIIFGNRNRILLQKEGGRRNSFATVNPNFHDLHELNFHSFFLSLLHVGLYHPFVISSAAKALLGGL